MGYLNTGLVMYIVRGQAMDLKISTVMNSLQPCIYYWGNSLKGVASPVIVIKNAFVLNCHLSCLLFSKRYMEMVKRDVLMERRSFQVLQEDYSNILHHLFHIHSLQFLLHLHLPLVNILVASFPRSAIGCICPYLRNIDHVVKYSLFQLHLCF